MAAVRAAAVELPVATHGSWPPWSLLHRKHTHMLHSIIVCAQAPTPTHLLLQHSLPVAQKPYKASLLSSPTCYNTIALVKLGVFCAL
jgi:hypothetical protein